MRVKRPRAFTASSPASRSVLRWCRRPRGSGRRRVAASGSLPSTRSRSSAASCSTASRASVSSCLAKYFGVRRQQVAGDAAHVVVRERALAVLGGDPGADQQCRLTVALQGREAQVGRLAQGGIDEDRALRPVLGDQAGERAHAFGQLATGLAEVRVLVARQVGEVDGRILREAAREAQAAVRPRPAARGGAAPHGSRPRSGTWARAGPAAHGRCCRRAPPRRARRRTRRLRGRRRRPAARRGPPASGSRRRTRGGARRPCSRRSPRGRRPRGARRRRAWR